MSGSVGKIDRGIVSVNAYGVYKNITFPLMFKIFKPKGTLKENDQYKTTIELASEIITELINFGFNIELVLADSLYGESSSFIRTLDKYKLPWILAIRSNHGVWMPSGQEVRANKWCKFQRTFSNQTSEIRYIREMIMSGYLMISLNTQPFLSLQLENNAKTERFNSSASLSTHPQWSYGNGWKNVLNNLRLIIQPTLLLCLLSPWLDIFPNTSLCSGFNDLIHGINQLQPFFSSA